MTDETTKPRALIIENIAQTVERITRSHHPAQELEDLNVAVVPHGFQTVDLEKFLARPRRIVRTKSMATFTGFCDYVLAHALDKRTAIYVGTDKATAVIDDIVPGENQPAWGEHRALLSLEKTAQWSAWGAHSGTFLAQRSFVNFVQDRAGEIAEPALGDLVQQLQAINAESTGSRRDAAGHLSAEQKREQQTRITNELPEYLELVMPILQCEPDQATSCRARLQVKLADEGVQFSVTLVNEAIIVDRRIRELVERLRSKVGKKVAVYF